MKIHHGMCRFTLAPLPSGTSCGVIESHSRTLAWVQKSAFVYGNWPLIPACGRIFTAFGRTFSDAAWNQRTWPCPAVLLFDCGARSTILGYRKLKCRTEHYIIVTFSAICAEMFSRCPRRCMSYACVSLDRLMAVWRLS